jgi:uncharacterized membrane protein YesL
MNKLFNLDNPFWNSMDKVFDLFIANVLWLVCCLPLFTIGPSTAAFYYVLVNMARGEDGVISRDFFRSFRQNFRQGVGLGLLMTAVGIFLAVDIRLCYRSGTGIYTFFMVFFAVLFLLWASLALYSFPLLAKFEKKNSEILVWAFLLAMGHPVQTLLMLLVTAVGLWACHLLPGLILIVFGLAGRFHSVLLASILKPYLPDPDIDEELKPLSFITEQENEDKK